MIRLLKEKISKLIVIVLGFTLFNASCMANPISFVIGDSPLFRDWQQNSNEKQYEEDNFLEIKTPGFAKNLEEFAINSICYRKLYLISLVFEQSPGGLEDLWSSLESAAIRIKNSDLRNDFETIMVEKMVVEGEEKKMSCFNAVKYLLDTWTIELAAHKGNRFYLDLQDMVGSEKADSEMRQFLFATLIGNRTYYLDQLNEHIMRQFLASSSNDVSENR